VARAGERAIAGMSSRDRFVATLRERGVIAADAPHPGEAADRPWFIAVLQGVAGWLAGVFLLLFLGLILRPDDASTIFIVGFMLLGAAWLIYYFDREGAFFDQFALALSIAGQIAVAWGILEHNRSGLTLAVTLLALQITVLVVMPNRGARTLAAFFATIAWVFTVRYLLAPNAGFDVIFGFDGRQEVKLPLGAWTEPLEWLLTWVPLLIIANWLIRRETAWMATGLRDHARPVLTGVLLGLALGGIAAAPFAWFAVGGVPGLGVEFSWRALFPLFSIGLAMFAAYGAFRLRSFGLAGFAILAGLLHLARFYYLYGTTLLWKSLIMLVMGVVLLALGIVLRRQRSGGLAA
jgi:hypothetical protein